MNDRDQGFVDGFMRKPYSRDTPEYIEYHDHGFRARNTPEDYFP